MNLRFDQIGGALGEYPTPDNAAALCYGYVANMNTAHSRMASEAALGGADLQEKGVVTYFVIDDVKNYVDRRDEIFSATQGLMIERVARRLEESLVAIDTAQAMMQRLMLFPASQRDSVREELGKAQRAWRAEFDLGIELLLKLRGASSEETWESVRQPALAWLSHEGPAAIPSLPLVGGKLGHFVGKAMVEAFVGLARNDHALGADGKWGDGSGWFAVFDWSRLFFENYYSTDPADSVASMELALKSCSIQIHGVRRTDALAMLLQTKLPGGAQFGSSVNWLTSNGVGMGASPVHAAAFWSPSSLKLLKNMGWNMALKDKNGDTPIMVLARHYNVDLGVTGNVRDRFHQASKESQDVVNETLDLLSAR